MRDLTDPTRKMSKSSPIDAPGVVRILDTPDAICRKIRRAVTDSDNRMIYDPEAKPGLANLAEIAAVLTGDTPQGVLAASRSYGDLKTTCADALIAELNPVRCRHDELLQDRDELQTLMEDGATRATAVAGSVVRRARAAMGLDVAVRSGRVRPQAGAAAIRAGRLVRMK